MLSMWPAGHAPLFDALVVDEAAQAVEPATLIPAALLRQGTSARAVLVGDPRQLPPTVLSRAAETALLAQSLFERLQRAGCSVQMLEEQHRMHPAIAAFPSSFFYEGRLANSDSVKAGSHAAPFHSHPCFTPFTLLDCQQGSERGGGLGRGGSLRNDAEAALAAALVAGLLERYGGTVGPVAVLTPYKAQLAALR
jgi:superfamily I DNA and/or RNA helicase